jgi:hypothetical protein
MFEPGTGKHQEEKKMEIRNWRDVLWEERRYLRPSTKNGTMLGKAKQTAVLNVKHNNIYCLMYLSRWHYLKQT